MHGEPMDASTIKCSKDESNLVHNVQQEVWESLAVPSIMYLYGMDVIVWNENELKKFSKNGTECIKVYSNRDCEGVL